VDEGGVTQKRLAPSPPRGLSPKHSHTIDGGGWGSSSSIPVHPSPPGLEVPDHGKGADKVITVDVRLKINGE
jgi:hypothetical protein